MSALADPNSFTRIARAMQRELFNRGAGFFTVDECADMLRASIDSALGIRERASAYLAREAAAEPEDAPCCAAS